MKFALRARPNAFGFVLQFQMCTLLGQHLNILCLLALCGDSESNSQGSPSSSDYGVQLGERYKRRRMLQFTGARTDILPTDSPSFTSVLPSGLEVRWYIHISYPLPPPSDNINLGAATRLWISTGMLMEPNIIGWCTLKQNCVNPSIPGSDDYLMPIFTAASPLWYTRNGMRLFISLQGLI